MLQQTTVAAVIPYFHRFLARFPTVAHLAAADLDDVLKLWAGLGYYARARNLHACARAVVAHHAGHFPQGAAGLRALPGIGDYTAAAIAAIAYDVRTVPVDGNVERVVARLFAIGEPLPRGKSAIRRAAETLAPARRAGDFAQALMDLGATVCVPKKPDCARCPLRSGCAADRHGSPEAFPVKAAKREGRLRRGAAYVVRRADGALLVRTRPARGLLGGMTEVPSTDWTHDLDEAAARADAPIHSRAAGLVRESRESLTSDPNPPRRGRGKIAWRRVPGVVSHAFTHFPLNLFVYVADVPQATAAPAGMRWVARANLEGEALPNLMRKVIAHAGLDRRPDDEATDCAGSVKRAQRAPVRAARRSR